MIQSFVIFIALRAGDRTQFQIPARSQIFTLCGIFMRQQKGHIFIAIFILLGCSRSTKNSITIETSNKQISNDSVGQVSANFLNLSNSKVALSIKDSSKYSQKFIAALLDGNGVGKKYKIIDDSILTDDKYKVGFSQVLPDNKEVTLTGQRNGNSYELRLRQLKLTTISYDFKLTGDDGKVIQEKGLADLLPSFMLGPEGDNDDDGGGYFCTEYFAYKKECLFAIRIGLKDGRIKGKVKGCDQRLTLDNCPTLK